MKEIKRLFDAPDPLKEIALQLQVENRRQSSTAWGNSTAPGGSGEDQPSTGGSPSENALTADTPE